MSQDKPHAGTALQKAAEAKPISMAHALKNKNQAQAEVDKLRASLQVWEQRLYEAEADLKLARRLEREKMNAPPPEVPSRFAGKVFAISRPPTAVYETVSQQARQIVDLLLGKETSAQLTGADVLHALRFLPTAGDTLVTFQVMRSRWLKPYIVEVRQEKGKTNDFKRSANYPS